MSKLNIEIDFSGLSQQESIDQLSHFQTMLSAMAASIGGSKNSAVTESKTEEPKQKKKVKEVKEKEVAEPVEEMASHESSDISIDEIRSLVSALVDPHRDSIKAKLKELGANNVGQLSEDNYIPFYNYLQEIKKIVI